MLSVWLSTTVSSRRASKATRASIYIAIDRSLGTLACCGVLLSALPIISFFFFLRFGVALRQERHEHRDRGVPRVPGYPDSLRGGAVPTLR